MKKLEEYRREIKKRSIVVSIFILCSFMAALALKGNLPAKENLTDYTSGFFTGVGIVLIFYVAFLGRALKNEEVLKKMYFNEKDEREILIKMKSGFPVVIVFSMAIILASLIVGYISYEAFITMNIIAFSQLIISIILKIYWSKKL